MEGRFMHRSFFDQMWSWIFPEIESRNNSRGPTDDLEFLFDKYEQELQYSDELFLYDNSGEAPVIQRHKVLPIEKLVLSTPQQPKPSRDMRASPGIDELELLRNRVEQLESENLSLKQQVRQSYAAPKAEAHIETARGMVSLPALQTLDKDLEDALESKAVRLLYVDAIQSMTTIERRQDLEAHRLASKIFVPPDKAKIMLKKNKRLIGFLTYGWRTRDHPDPDNKTLEEVKHTLKHDLGRHILAVFWDFASLFQWPRSDEQDKLFQQGLQVMAIGYASPLSTTVIRCEWIPMRPAEFDGVVSVFPDAAALAARHASRHEASHSSGMDTYRPTSESEAKLKQQLEGSDRKVIEMDWEQARTLDGEAAAEEMGRWRVKFETHEMAEQACKDKTITPEMCLWYNEQALGQRGWPIFENAVSTEAISRAVFYPQLKELLVKGLPAKVINISKEKHPVPVHFEETEGAGVRINKIRSFLQDANFTGKGDKIVVLRLFNNFTSKIGIAMQTVAKQLKDDVSELRYEGQYNSQGQKHGEGT